MITPVRSTKLYEHVTGHGITGQFVRYALVGCVNVSVFFGVFNLLLHLGVHELPANMCAFAVASVGSFFLNKRWAFKDQRSHAVHRQYVVFVFFTLIGLALQTSAFTVLLVPLREYGTLGKNAAALATIPISVLWNFNAYRRWTFRHRHDLSTNASTPV